MIDPLAHQGHPADRGSQVPYGPAGPEPRLALVLGAGGVRGIAHIGVLLGLAQRGIRPDVVVGTSVGALVGACYAAMGWDAPRMAGAATGLSRFASLWMLSRHRPLQPLAPLLSGRGGWLAQVMEALKECEFERLYHGVRVLGVTCYDLVSRREMFFCSSMEASRPTLEQAVLGSASLPMLCPSLKVGVDGARLRLVDGGLSRTVPVDRALQPPVSAARTLAIDLDVATGWNERGLDHRRRLEQRYGERLRIVRPAVRSFGTILMRGGDARRLVEAGRAAVTAELAAWAAASL